MEHLPTQQVLENLREDSLQLLHQVEQLSINASLEMLEKNDGYGRWNSVQVLEHLNTYYRYYLPLIEAKIKSAPGDPAPFFRPGWLGAFFTRSMQPLSGTIKHKMKALKKHVPALALDKKQVMTEFLDWQRKLVYIIQLSEAVNLNNISIPITITPLIRLKLGDVLQFIVAHNNRHFLQIENLLGEVQVSRSSGYLPG
jgi:hypothetical protein